MTDLTTHYLGLKLKSPIIAGSSGLTKSIDNLVQLEQHGAGAVVLKSLFEEQILHESAQQISNSEASTGYGYAEAYDLIGNYAKEHQVSEYLDLIKAAKQKLTIPVIASINCVSATEWTSFAKRIEQAGADALELNVFILPVNTEMKGDDYKNIYLNIIEKVKKSTNLPIALKIGSYFTDMANWIQRLSWTGLEGVVMFNRFYTPDIDIEKMKLIGGGRFSNKDEFMNSMRWIGILSDEVKCDLCASSGIHSGETVIKQLLSGAKAVQMTSVLYQNGFEEIAKANADITAWMEKNEFTRLDQFVGKLSMKQAENPAAYNRVQFMKHFAGIE